MNKYNELAADLPDDVIRVAESGVFGSVELEDYARAGADAVLVGEGVATAANHEQAVERLVKAGARVKASDQTPLASHEGPYFGQFGGRYVPEALITALDELERVYMEAKADPEFHKELARLNQQYVGRPSPLTEAPRFAQRLKEKTGLDARVFLKREDLNHTAPTRSTTRLDRPYLVKRQWAKPSVIAETGAGQHGVATATVCAMLGLKCRIYMGQIDARRQALNVARMRMLARRSSKSPWVIASSRTPSTRRCATGSPTSKTPIICSARSQDLIRSHPWCATSKRSLERKRNSSCRIGMASTIPMLSAHASAAAPTPSAS